jgi:dienelactone hydrolase
MATPTLSKTTLAGALGAILIDVRAAARSTPGPAVLVLHGFKGFKDWGMFPPFAERLARAGFTAISFNVSGSGVDESGTFAWPERFGHNTFSAELADIGLVLDALEGGRLGVATPTSIGLVGHSRGGGMAILTASRRPRIGALVTWAAISHVRRWSETQAAEWEERGRLDVVNARTGEVLPMYRDVLDDIRANGTGSLDIEAAAGRIGVPWLVVHGERDEAVPVSEAERLARLARAPGSRTLLVADTGHTFGAVHPFAGESPALERVFTETTTFLSDHLG